MHRGVPTIDYASFLIECEPDLFQTHYLAEWNETIVNHLDAHDQKRHTRVHALGATKAGRRRYVLTASGAAAARVERLPFEKWADHLTRYDIRARLYDCADDTYERLCIALQHAETRNNIETFDVSVRTKNHTRDTGGKGVRYGSRKSDISSKVYKRGIEKPAVETIIQDDVLDELVLSTLEACNEASAPVNGWNGLWARAVEVQSGHFRNWFFQSGIEGDLDGVRHEAIPMPERLKKMFQLDMWAGGAALPLPDDDGPADLQRLAEPD